MPLDQGGRLFRHPQGGVDVVLNSLAGDYIAAGMRTLRDGGRFVEIGRRDILAGTGLSLDLFMMQRTFSSYNPPSFDSPDFAAAFRSVAELIRAGIVQPLPVKPFPVEQTGAAFTFMSRAQHIGKVVLTRAGADARPGAGRSGVSGVRSEGITAVTGLRAIYKAFAVGAAHLLVNKDSADAQGEEFLVAEHVLQSTADAAVHSRPALGYGCVPLSGETEERLGAIWADALSIEQVGREDRFLDLGGDSLYATQVVARIRRQFGVRIAPANILGNTPLRALADLIDHHGSR